MGSSFGRRPGLTCGGIEPFVHTMLGSGIQVLLVLTGSTEGHVQQLDVTRYTVSPVDKVVIFQT